MGRKSGKNLEHRGAKQLQQIGLSASFSGPLPPPSVLQRYDDVLPGAAERIVAMAERQSAHRQQLEEKVVSGGVVAERRGQVMGFIVAMTAMLGGFWLMSQGRSALGISAVFADLAAFVAVFVYGRHRQARERSERLSRFAQRAS